MSETTYVYSSSLKILFAFIEFMESLNHHLGAVPQNNSKIKEIRNTKKANTSKQSISTQKLSVHFAFYPYLTLSEADGAKTATYFGNRSAAYLMVQQFEQAIDDCHTATQIDPKFVKVNS